MSYDLEQLKKDLQKKKEQRLIMVNTNWGKEIQGIESGS